MPLPAGLEYGQKLPTPLWTPSTKAEIGDKDENIKKEQAYDIVGERVGRRVEKLSLEIYSIAAKRVWVKKILERGWMAFYVERLAIGEIL